MRTDNGKFYYDNGKQIRKWRGKKQMKLKEYLN